MNPIGKISIRNMIRGMSPLDIILFPAKKYKSMEAVRARASEEMQETKKKSHFITSKEPEGIYVIRLR